MKKRGELLKVYILTAMVLPLLIAAPDASGGPDIQGIGFITSKNWRAGSLETNPFELFAMVNGDGITSVTVTSPTGITTVGEPRDGLWVLELAEDYHTLNLLRQDFPVGNYMFTFNGGVDSVTVYTNPIEPTGWANVTYPSDGATDVPLNPTFTWDSCVGYGDELHVDVGYKGFDILLYQAQLGIAETSWTPGTLCPGHLHRFEPEVHKGSTQSYSLVTDQGDSFTYTDVFSYSNEILFTTVIPAPGAFVLAVIGVGIFGCLRRHRTL
jgi:hypothetical protein